MIEIVASEDSNRTLTSGRNVSWSRPSEVPVLHWLRVPLWDMNSLRLCGNLDKVLK